MQKAPLLTNVYSRAGKKISPVYKLDEPYSAELQRIRYKDLSKKGIAFGYKLEALSNSSHLKSHPKLFEEKKIFYNRYFYDKNSSSLGLVLTNIDKTRVTVNELGTPLFWQMGEKRRELAVAQRALYFDQNQNEEIYKIIGKMESGKIRIPVRPNKRIKTVEKALGISKDYPYPTRTPAISELGYKKISYDGLISRREVFLTGLFNKVGKYPRRIMGLGSMPPVTGWRDTIVTAAIGHMVSFIPRNSLFAENIERRVDLAKNAKEVIDSLDIPNLWKEKVKRNIGASLGLGLNDPREEVKTAEKLFKEAGIKLFRMYTIGAHKRVIETARAIREELGKDVELFVGQIADKKQAEKLISPKIAVDGLVYGHGGGQQCTSAINGMAITTLEDVYEIVRDPAFNQTTILVEGGIDRSIGTALILGVDCCLGNQKMVHGTIETGDIFVEHIKGKICQPYPGSASPVTQLIESEDETLRERRLDASGRTYNPEGKPGFMYFEKKANSMTFWINEYLSYAARTLADLGAKNMSELRSIIGNQKSDFLRIMSEKTQYLSDAFGNYN